MTPKNDVSMPRSNTGGKCEALVHYPSPRVSYYLYPTYFTFLQRTEQVSNYMYCTLCKKLEQWAKTATCQGAVYLLEQGMLAGEATMHYLLIEGKRKERWGPRIIYHLCHPVAIHSL